MRALWVEDHALIGDSLAMLLQVVAPELSLDKARDIATARRLACAIPYDLVLLDWWLGPETGECAMAELRSSGCHAPFLVVSGDDRDVVRKRALALGAIGFVAKSATPEVLVDAMKRALAEGAGCAPQRPTEGGERRDVPASPERPAIDIGTLFPELTDRQAEVLRELMSGLSDKEIARRLGVAHSTVRSHVRAVLEAIGVHRRGEASHVARLRGASEL